MPWHIYLIFTSLKIGQKMVSDIENINWTYEFSCASLTPQTKSLFFLKPITNQEVSTHLQALNLAKSVGLDSIPLKFSVISAQILAPVLVELYHKRKLEVIAEFAAKLTGIAMWMLLLRSPRHDTDVKGIYPNTFKIGQIVSIYKKAVAISSSTAICLWNLFCCNHLHVFI